MGNKLYFYFFKEFSYFFIVVLFSLSIIGWVIQAVNFLDFVTEDGHSFNIYFLYTLLNFPKILSKLIPFCFFISLFITINKFEKNNETLIMWLYGINKITIINFIFVISILILLLHLILSIFVTPYSLNLARKFLKYSDIGFYSALIKEKKFNDTVKDLTIFVEEKTTDGKLKNIFLRDDSGLLNETKTIIAKKGEIINFNKKRIIVLHNGVIQNKKKNNKNLRGKFWNFCSTSVGFIINKSWKILFAWRSINE